MQRKTIEEVETELQLPSSQLLALFAKAVRKVSKYLQDLQRSAISAELPAPVDPEQNGRLNLAPVAKSIEDELREAGKEVNEEEKARRRELIEGLDLKKYAINVDVDWSAAEAQVGRAAGDKGKMSSVVSLKREDVRKRKGAEENENEVERKKKKIRRGKKGA